MNKVTEILCVSAGSSGASSREEVLSERLANAYREWDELKDDLRQVENEIDSIEDELEFLKSP